MTGKQRQVVTLMSVADLLRDPLVREKMGRRQAQDYARLMATFAAELHVIARELVGSASMFADVAESDLQTFLQAVTSAAHAEEMTKRVRDGLR